MTKELKQVLDKLDMYKGKEYVCYRMCDDSVWYVKIIEDLKVTVFCNGKTLWFTEPDGLEIVGEL